MDLAFGAIGRLNAIKHALANDLRAAKREREPCRDDVVVPREVFEALMRGWYLAGGMDGAARSIWRA